MTAPTHVLVAVPIDCAACNNTGRVACSWLIGPDGPICPECRGERYRTDRVTLEDFACMLDAARSTRRGRR